MKNSLNICTYVTNSNSGRTGISAFLQRVAYVRRVWLVGGCLYRHTSEESKMATPDVEIIVGTYEEFLLGYKAVKKGDSVSPRNVG